MNGAIDRQSALAAAGDRGGEREFRLARRDGEKFRAHGASGKHRVAAQAFGQRLVAVAMRVANRRARDW